jgi:hypothetical protein
VKTFNADSTIVHTHVEARFCILESDHSMFHLSAIRNTLENVALINVWPICWTYKCFKYKLRNRKAFLTTVGFPFRKLRNFWSLLSVRVSCWSALSPGHGPPKYENHFLFPRLAYSSALKWRQRVLWNVGGDLPYYLASHHTRQ